MSAEETTILAEKIAKQIQTMKSLSERKLSLKSKLNGLNEEVRVLLEELNRIEEIVKSIKHEIANDLNETFELKVVKGE